MAICVSAACAQLRAHASDGRRAQPLLSDPAAAVVSTATSLLGVVATVDRFRRGRSRAVVVPLLLMDWKVYEMAPEGSHVLAIRCLLLAATAVLVNALGAAIRSESARNKATAEQLAVANENLLAAEAADAPRRTPGRARATHGRPRARTAQPARQYQRLGRSCWRGRPANATPYRANSAKSSVRKSTAPIFWSRVFSISRGRSSRAAKSPTSRRSSTAPPGARVCD